jgi:hypothetical protein
VNDRYGGFLGLRSGEESILLLVEIQTMIS